MGEISDRPTTKHTVNALTPRCILATVRSSGIYHKTWKPKPHQSESVWLTVTDLRLECVWAMKASPGQSQHHVEVIQRMCVSFCVCVMTNVWDIRCVCVRVCVAHYAGQGWVLQSSSRFVGSRAGSQRSAGTVAWESLSTHSQSTWRLPGKCTQTDRQTHTHTHRKTRFDTFPCCNVEYAHPNGLMPFCIGKL